MPGLITAFYKPLCGGPGHRPTADLMNNEVMKEPLLRCYGDAFPGIPRQCQFQHALPSFSYTGPNYFGNRKKATEPKELLKQKMVDKLIKNFLAEQDDAQPHSHTINSDDHPNWNILSTSTSPLLESRREYGTSEIRRRKQRNRDAHYLHHPPQSPNITSTTVSDSAPSTSWANLVSPPVQQRLVATHGDPLHVTLPQIADNQEGIPPPPAYSPQLVPRLKKIRKKQTLDVGSEYTTGASPSTTPFHLGSHLPPTPSSMSVDSECSVSSGKSVNLMMLADLALGHGNSQEPTSPAVGVPRTGHVEILIDGGDMPLDLRLPSKRESGSPSVLSSSPGFSDYGGAVDKSFELQRHAVLPQSGSYGSCFERKAPDSPFSHGFERVMAMERGKRDSSVSSDATVDYSDLARPSTCPPNADSINHATPDAEELPPSVVSGLPLQLPATSEHDHGGELQLQPTESGISAAVDTGRADHESSTESIFPRMSTVADQNIDSSMTEGDWELDTSQQLSVETNSLPGTSNSTLDQDDNAIGIARPKSADTSSAVPDLSQPTSSNKDAPSEENEHDEIQLAVIDDIMCVQPSVCIPPDDTSGWEAILIEQMNLWAPSKAPNKRRTSKAKFGSRRKPTKKGNALTTQHNKAMKGNKRSTCPSSCHRSCCIAAPVAKRPRTPGDREEEVATAPEMDSNPGPSEETLMAHVPPSGASWHNVGARDIPELKVTGASPSASKVRGCPKSAPVPGDQPSPTSHHEDCDCPPYDHLQSMHAHVICRQLGPDLRERLALQTYASRFGAVKKAATAFIPPVHGQGSGTAYGNVFFYEVKSVNRMVSDYATSTNLKARVCVKCRNLLRLGGKVDVNEM